MRSGRTTGASLTLAALLALFASSAGGQVVDAAAVALRAGNASNAIALATQALADASLTPRDRAHVLIDRGLAHEMLGERDAALIDFTAAIDARVLAPPEQARALYDRGVTLDELGRTDDAVGDYSAAIRIEPKFAVALNNRGNAWRRLGKPDAARADYQASIAAGNPHLEYPNFGLGQVAEAAGDADTARAYYRAALAADPQFALPAERLTALGNAPPSADAPVVLRPPGGGEVHLKPPGESEVHLTPPGQTAVHLRPPRAPRPPRLQTPAAPAPGLDLKPAFSEATPAPGETIQLGAWRNEADAADAWNRIVATGGNLLAGLSPQVVPIDLPGRGRFYRLRAGPVYPGVGPGLCDALKAKGLECAVVRH